MRCQACTSWSRCLYGVGVQRAGKEVREFLKSCARSSLQQSLTITRSGCDMKCNPSNALPVAKVVHDVGESYGWCACFACATPVLGALNIRQRRRPLASPTAVLTALETSTTVIHKLRAVEAEDNRHVPLVQPHRLHFLAKFAFFSH